MIRTLPGATISFDDAVPGAADSLLSAIYAGGDLMLSQVAHISGLDVHVIQNWVARGYLSPPVEKRYSRRQLSRILLIHLLRGVLPLEEICRLLRYVNGHLDDESDDAVDDTRLYVWLTELFCAPAQKREEGLRACIAAYSPPFPGAEIRVEQVLRIMLDAADAAELKRRAEERIAQLDER